ncbi:efflux transporter outer membrane subunit [Bordetella sp. 15P40C-2]|uniref:efflux transporter outer membrane subunit n=1 Tax=Bordetella sp. 15P40C-2 TaxID=2572246 RepID=UPI001320D27F|nr:efflux transporter outer membrane subunit [Bordetella sp. 15P40C-2]MVW72598.1 efflux transporter outer membrane subunit [Bordetella sp. 15P40C-2]
MFDERRPGFASLLLTISVATLTLAGCTVGPNFTKPTTQAPDDWTSWRSVDDSLRVTPASDAALPPKWWRAFEDPVLDRLLQRAFEASPDLMTAALRFAQARAQRDTTAAQRGPDLSANGGVTRQRQSEYGAGTRLIDAVAGGANRDEVVKLLSEPFTLYQAGFDASWELDLWGRVRRSVEAADADVAQQAALLDMARLSLASDVARAYFGLRTAQRQISLTREDIAALQERLSLLEAYVRGGTMNHLNLQQQRAEVSMLKAQLPGLLAQEGANINQISLLLGVPPGELRQELTAAPTQLNARLPDLALGLPSEVAKRRPDIRAAEARLHSATANIGIAQAALYPSIRLGARFGYESYLSGEFADWGSRTWSIGPSLDLPIFDHGRRKSVVRLRELQQQEAAVNYQQTVLKAWQEIDDALSAYTADQQALHEQELRVQAAQDAYQLAQARYEGGAADFLTVLDTQRSYIAARRDLATSQGQMNNRYVAVNKALGNVSSPPVTQTPAPQ